MSAVTWAVGVDVGGTFTDFYAFDRASGTVEVYKRPSTPENPAEAIVWGLAEMCAERAIDSGTVAWIGHGTTVATNALIQRRGGRVTLITTRGFRDLLEIGRQTRPHMYSLQDDHPAPLVPRERRLEVEERVTTGGGVLRALQEPDVSAAIRAVRDLGADACAVCFLFSFQNPEHERAVGTALARAAPELHVSLSSDVQPEFREYERLSTTVLNAYLQPVMGSYLSYLEEKLRAAAPRASIRIYQSSGGLMSVERARKVPVRTALSGPAAGAVGAIYQARLADKPNVILLDMGGTSADVCLFRDYETGMSLDRDIAGFPVRLPMVDISTVGAGGGSIAWFDRDGLLKVGPVSAGADPGPACYGRGGSDATVTDANLLVGRLSPRGLLGGRMALDVEPARAAIAPLARRLDYSPERTALGILGIVVANMVRAIRGVSVERGHDPRRFALLAFGGAGALHAGDVAKALGIHEVIVPPSPGILCAQGLIVSDLKEDIVRSDRIPVDDEHIGRMADLVGELEEEAATWFAGEGVPRSRRAVDVVFDMRYVGQNFELPVAVARAAGSRSLRLPDSAALRKMFFEAHEQQYGFHNPDDRIEIVNLRMKALGRARLPNGQAKERRATAPPEPTGHRRVHFVSAAAIETPVFDRASLAPRHRLKGPAVIEQFDATTLLHPGDSLKVDDALNLVLKVGS